MIIIGYAARVCKDGRIQTVPEHSIGVFEKGEKDAQYLGASSIYELVAKLHDMGKNTPESDLYQRTVGSGEEWKKEKIIHSHAGARYIYNRYVKDNENRDKYDIYLAEIISVVIMSHHGLFDTLAPSYSSLDSKHINNKFVKKIENSDYNYEESQKATFEEILSPEEIDSLYQRAKEEFINIFSVMKGKCNNLTTFSFWMGMYERILLSILINADHTDAAEFSSNIKIETLYGDKDCWEKCSKYFERKISDFDSTSNIGKIRSEISNCALASSLKPGKIVRMSVATGGGKTLSGLRYAINHCAHFNKSRIFYVAPYNSILEQNSKEINKYLPDGINVLEHFGEIIKYENNTPKDIKYFTENWGSLVIATSMVQMLNTLFNGTITSIRRMRSLVNSVIIFDEIQSLPIECTSMFNMAVNFLSEICGVTIVLCSATQPVLEKVEFSINLEDNKDIVGDFDAYCKKLKRTQIVDKLKPSGYTYLDTAQFLYEKSIENKSVLCVVNTKVSARSIFNLFKSIIGDKGLKDEYHIIHLSTNMCPEHRSEKIEKLREYLKSDKKIVCISTQLIEAGVDISFNAVIRSLAGLDSIIQAAGRCNRNFEEPVGFVYVIDISDENVDKIKSIKYGQKITRSIFMNMRKNPSLFGGDISSPSSISHYYEAFYKNSNDDLNYWVKSKNYSLVDLLSVNTVGSKVYQEYSENSQKPKLKMKQAFKTAGDTFEAIDDHSVSVLVPYEKGMELIETIVSGIQLNQLKELMPDIQKYSIGIPNTLCNPTYVAKNSDTGINILRDGFYDDEYGFTEKAEMKFLCE